MVCKYKSKSYLTHKNIHITQINLQLRQYFLNYSSLKYSANTGFRTQLYNLFFLIIFTRTHLLHIFITSITQYASTQQSNNNVAHI